METVLAGKTALVTGGNGGLGRAIAVELHRAGAKVVAADLAVDKVEAFIREAGLPGMTAAELNVTNSASVNKVVDEMVQSYGAVDILVNSAGITFRHEPLGFPEDAFDRIMAVNVKGSFLCCQAAARRMAERGGGKIINIGSIGCMRALPNTVAYCISKGAIANMTHSLALDLAKHKINVNAIAPSTVKTSLADQVFQDPEALKWFVERIPMGRLCEAEDVAKAALFLASSAADFITGHILPVDGGWLA